MQFDHLGGGFHRYSVDEYWHVPVSGREGGEEGCVWGGRKQGCNQSCKQQERQARNGRWDGGDGWAGGGG